MRYSGNFFAALGLAAAVAVAGVQAANAECQRYGFTVNDYGKDGPTKDAKDLLDKLIQTKMTERGVSDFRTGKKSVSCELFLNFIVFDEHTCTAEATVCWGASKLPGGEQQSAAEPAGEEPAAKKPAKHAAAHDPAAPAPQKSADNIPDPKSMLAHKKKPAAAPVETGSLNEAAPKHAAAKQPAADDGAGYPTPESPSQENGAQ
jgi:hypothetical protein